MDFYDLKMYSALWDHFRLLINVKMHKAQLNKFTPSHGNFSSPPPSLLEKTHSIQLVSFCVERKLYKHHFLCLVSDTSKMNDCEKKCYLSQCHFSTVLFLALESPTDFKDLCNFFQDMSK